MPGTLPTIHYNPWKLEMYWAAPPPPPPTLRPHRAQTLAIMEVALRPTSVLPQVSLSATAQEGTLTSHLGPCSPHTE